MTGIFSTIASVPEVRTWPLKFIYYVSWNITRDYAECKAEARNNAQPYINGYNSGRTGVIFVSFGMQAQLD